MTEQEKFYSIYRGYYFKYGHDWAKKVGKYEKKNSEPFAKVTREVNSAMRRYLGGEKFGKYIDLMEYMMLKEGLLVKTEDNKLDVPQATFELWLVTGRGRRAAAKGRGDPRPFTFRGRVLLRLWMLALPGLSCAIVCSPFSSV